MAVFALREKKDLKGNLKGFQIANIGDDSVHGVLEGLPEGKYTVAGDNVPLTNAQVTYVTKQVNHIG
jgi:hypothetical protein